jgi:hypothetical protein
MCSSCKSTNPPVFTKILPNGHSLTMCAACLRRGDDQTRLQLQTASTAHHCRVGLQYQALRPRLLRVRASGES